MATIFALFLCLPQADICQQSAYSFQSRGECSEFLKDYRRYNQDKPGVAEFRCLGRSVPVWR